MEKDALSITREYKQSNECLTSRNAHKVFSTLGELKKIDLSYLVFDAELLQNVKEAIYRLSDGKVKILCYGTGEFKGAYSIICIMQSRKNKSLREGKQSAYIYNCDKPEISAVEELVVKKNWLGQYAWEDS